MLSIIAIISVFFAISLPAFAVSPDATEIGLGIDKGVNATERYYGCPNGDKHEMTGKGLGYAYYGSAGSKDLRISGGTATQCKNCYLVLITENNPFMVGVTWGNYATWNPGEPVGTNVIMYTNSFGYANSFNDPFVQGFNFGR